MVGANRTGMYKLIYSRNILLLFSPFINSFANRIGTRTLEIVLVVNRDKKTQQQS